MKRVLVIVSSWFWYLNDFLSIACPFPYLSVLEWLGSYCLFNCLFDNGGSTIDTILLSWSKSTMRGQLFSFSTGITFFPKDTPVSMFTFMSLYSLDKKQLEHKGNLIIPVAELA